MREELDRHQQEPPAPEVSSDKGTGPRDRFVALRPSQPEFDIGMYELDRPVCSVEEKGAEPRVERPNNPQPTKSNTYRWLGVGVVAPVI